MAELELITGRTGEQHVLAIDDAEIYRTLLGNGDFILSTGHKFEATPRSANRILVYDGTAVIQGRQMKIRSGSQELETEGGVVGFRREDAIVLEYSKSGDIETAQLKVIKGANDSSAYKPPALIQGNIDAGQTRQVRIWGVRYEGYDFKGLIDYRTILDTTPIQTALDTATSGLRNIQAIITSYQSQIDGDMSSYQSQIETRLEAIRGAVNVAPLTTLCAHNVITGANVARTVSYEVGVYPKTLNIGGLGFTAGDEVNGCIGLFNGGSYREEEVAFCVYGTAVDNDYRSYDGNNTVTIKNVTANDPIIRASVYKGAKLSIPAGGYTYNSNDIFIVYVNGLKLPVDIYTVDSENSNLIVSSSILTANTTYDDVEIEVWRPEEA